MIVLLEYNLMFGYFPFAVKAAEYLQNNYELQLTNFRNGSSPTCLFKVNHRTTNV